MRTLLKRLFGHEEIVREVYEKLAGSKAEHFTTTERAESARALFRSYEPFKLIQRFLALLVSLTYVGVWAICAMLMVSSVFFMGSELGDTIREVAVEIANLNRDTLEWPAILVLSLYFGGGVVEGIVERVRTPNVTGTGGRHEEKASQ
jgi:hypothetical protein